MHSGHVPILYLVHHGDVQQMDLFDGFSFGVSSFRRRCDLDLSDCVHTSIHAVFKQEKGNWILQNFGESLQVEDPFRKDQTILPKNTQRRMPDKAMIRLLKKETESVFLIFDDSAAQNNGWKQADRDDPRFLAYGDQLPAQESCTWIDSCLYIHTGKKIIYEVPASQNVPSEEIENGESDPGLSINVREVTAGGRFHKTPILKDVHLTMLPGEMVMLLGGSGSGKSTFMEAATDLVPSDTDVFFQGHDLLHGANERNLFCMVPQSPEAHYRMADTVYHTLDDAAILYAPEEIAGDKNKRRKRVMTLLQMMDLDSVSNSKCSSLSGGQQRKLGILLEYIAEPQIMFLDEPDSGVDGAKVTDIMQHLRAIADEGKILCVITHTPDRIRNYFNKVAVIAKGSGGYGTLAYYGTIPNALNFFESESLEDIVGKVSGQPEGADTYIRKFKMLQEIEK